MLYLLVALILIALAVVRVSLRGHRLCRGGQVCRGHCAAVEAKIGDARAVGLRRRQGALAAGL